MIANQRDFMTDKITLVTSNVLLRPFEKEDLQYLVTWFNDADLRNKIGEISPMTIQDANNWFEKTSDDESRKWFAIELIKSKRIIGEAGLLRIFKEWKTTDMSIVIAEKDCQRKGYGVEIANVLLEYAFQTLKLHRVSIGVVSFNQIAINFWKKVGFKEEGIQRDGYFCNNKYHDFVMMSFLEGEYHGNSN